MMTHLLLHAGNLLYLAAYSVRDIMWLRILTVVATLCLMPYYCIREAPLYAPILWCSLFTMVNLVQIAVLFLERRPVFLGEEELRLYRTVFSALSPREFTKLLESAQWSRAQPGDELLIQDKPTPALMLVATGSAAVEIDGRRVAEIVPGQFIGEMGFLTRQPASARVTAVEPIEYLAWQTKQLHTKLESSPHLHLKFQSILGGDLADKLRRNAALTAHPSKLIATLHDAGAE